VNGKTTVGGAFTGRSAAATGLVSEAIAIDAIPSLLIGILRRRTIM
jgi:hypothetical protein